MNLKRSPNSKKIAGENKVFRSFIGLGYYDCITPPVIQRNVLENPGWYTPYTPYQAEISQGRLEALLNFQTMVDRPHRPGHRQRLAARRSHRRRRSHDDVPSRSRTGQERFLRLGELPSANHRSRAHARPRRWASKSSSADHEDFSVQRQSFRRAGAVSRHVRRDSRLLRHCVEQAHAAGALVTVATDLLALTLLKPPGEFGADIAVGSAQRFGVPLGYGGPHAAFFATRDAFKRQMPGRIVGVSKDSRGKPALRLALANPRAAHPPRKGHEQHLHRAGAAGEHGVACTPCYHGPEGLKKIARRVHALTASSGRWLWRSSASSRIQRDILSTRSALSSATSAPAEILKAAEAQRMNFRAD